MSEKLSQKMKFDVCNERLKKAHEALWAVEAGHEGDNLDCATCFILAKCKHALGINQ
jgi:hypothetical protein